MLKSKTPKFYHKATELRWKRPTASFEVIRRLNKTVSWFMVLFARPKIDGVTCARLFCQAIKAAGSVLLMVGMGNRCRLYVEDSAWQSAVVLRKENARRGVHNLVLFYVCPKCAFFCFTVATMLKRFIAELLV